MGHYGIMFDKCGSFLSTLLCYSHENLVPSPYDHQSGWTRNSLHDAKLYNLSTLNLQIVKFDDIGLFLKM